MATHANRSTWGMFRLAACSLIFMSAAILSTRGAQSPDEPVKPERARQALRLAIDHYKRGDFETADKWFAYAKAGQQNLTSPDQEDLNTFGSQNALALKSKQEGSAQLRLAEEAIQKGQTVEAAALLKALNGNQYLTEPEKQHLADLNRRAQTMPQSPAPAKGDAKALLAAGRSALNSGDLNTAENLLAQAEKASSGLAAWMQPWNDSPAKLRRDIQTARTKQQSMLPKTEPESKDSSWLPKWFGKNEKSDKSDKAGPSLVPDAPPSDPQKSQAKNSGGLWPFGNPPTPPAKKESGPSGELAFQEKIARHMVADGYRALEMGNVGVAVQFATKAKELNVTFAPNEPSPDSLMQEIQRRGPNPATVAKKSNDPIPSGDGRAMLRHGRNLLAQKKFDEADKLCNHAQAAKDVRWGLFEDTPDKLRRDIQRLRQTHEREESFKVMAEARKLYVDGKYDDAERKAYLAQKLHGPYGVFDFGDRPNKLIDEIQHTRKAKGIAPMKKEEPQVARNEKGDPNKVIPPPPPTMPAEMMNANKNRAMVMVREARELERQGMLADARQKAFEARTLKAVFAPEEDSPDSVLLSVSAKCEKQIVAHLHQVVQHVHQANDPQRFEKAGVQILEARKLAQAFDLDTGRIEQTTHYVQQLASGAKVAPLAIGIQRAEVSTGDPQKDALRRVAREKLRDAQNELAHGKYASARKMAEDLYDAKYGIQEDVARLLRSISAEEFNQQLLQAKRTFEAALEAYVAKNYQKAMFLFQECDPSLLPDRYQARLRDIMATREMQPDRLVQAGHTVRQLLKGEKIIENKGEPTAMEREDLLEEAKRKEIVQYQQLRQQGVEVLRRANDLFNAKQVEEKQRAIDALKAYCEQVNLAQFEPARANELKRLPEARVQQYRNQLAQHSIMQNEKNMQFPMKYDETGRVRAEGLKQEQVAEKMKLVHELMKQNKLAEADAEVAKVLAIDSENLAGLAAKRIIGTRKAQEEHDRNTHDQERFFMGALNAKQRPLVDTDNPIAFGDPKRTQMRNQGGSGGGIPYQLKDEKERAIHYRLQKPISLHMKDVPLQKAIQDISLMSGVQMVPDLGPLQDARVNLEAPLSISVEDIPMKSALNILLSPMKLSYVIEDHVLKVTTETRTRGRLVRYTYPIADLVVAVENHPIPDVFNIQKALERTMQPQQFFPSYLSPPAFPGNQGAPVSSHGSMSEQPSNHSGGYSLTPQAGGGSTRRTPEDMANLLMGLIKNAVSKNSWDDMAGTGTIQYFPQGLALVINQTQEVQEEVQQLLASLRKLQDLQVSVELRAVLVSETFFERIGVDFDMNIRTPTNRREPDLVNGTFVPAPFINRTADRLNGLVSGLTSAGTLTPDLNIPVRNSTFNFTTPQFGGYQPEAGISLGLAFLSDIQVFMFLEAVQGDRRAHIMQAPKITVFNGQQATIFGLMSRPVITNLIPTALGNGTMVLMPNFTQMPFGLGMQVQPTVSPDRRFIRLNVTPIAATGQQDPAGATVIAIPGTAGGTFDGGGAQPPFANNPLNVTIVPTQVNLTVVNTTVNVPDGGTVLLGGFKFLAEERSEYGPPVLSKIPYLSRLFRNVGWSRDGSTLIYLVTARVIMVEEEEQLFLGNIAPIPGR